MALKNISAFGIYPDQSKVDAAVEALKAAGFRGLDISVLFPHNLGSKDFAHERHTKAPEGAVAGGGSGAIAGAAFGWLLGAGTLAVPGLETFAVAGPLMAMLGGMGAGAMLGGITGALIGFGVPEFEAKRYAGRVHKGGVLLSVHCDSADWAKQAMDVLKQTGASDVSTAGEAKADFARSERPMARSRISSEA